MAGPWPKSIYKRVSSSYDELSWARLEQNTSKTCHCWENGSNILKLSVNINTNSEDNSKCI